MVMFSGLRFQFVKTMPTCELLFLEWKLVVVQL